MHDIWIADVPYGSTLPTVVRATASGPGAFPTLTTEVSVSGRVLLWTEDGQIHAVSY